MNSNLNCLVTNCAYNKSGYCHASHIKIEGYDATVTPETYCESFISKSESNLSSNISNNLTTTQNISCNAKNCTYNLQGSCNASHVLINLKTAVCDTLGFSI